MYRVKQNNYLVNRIDKKQRKMIDNYISTHAVKKIQLGCGNNILTSWLNTDLFMNDKVVFLDIRKPFPILQETFNYVYCEHTIEHIDFTDGQKMLNECFRILVPGGKIRIATPDIAMIIGLYSENKTDLENRYIHWTVDTWMSEIGIYNDTFAINNFFYNWSHRFIYDQKTLTKSLEMAGFERIQKCIINLSNDEVFCDIEHHSAVYNEEFNKLETFVLEAQKPG